MSSLFLNKKELEDEELLLRYRKRDDAESLGILYDRYLHLVYGLCLKYLKSRDQSQDAVMDIYEVLVSKLKTQEVTYFKSWLYMVSKNHCLMILRKTTREIPLEENFMENGVSMHPYEEDSMESNLTVLEECIDKLRMDQKQCVSLFYLERKSYEEIVQISAFKISKVKSYIQNGKRNLKMCLESKNVRG